jgi:hypothetical protein
MFTANVGTPDRIARIVVGLALLVWFFMDPGTGTLHWLKAVLGLVVLGTAVRSFCPLYRVLGIRTN